MQISQTAYEHYSILIRPGLVQLILKTV